ncbi:MAG: hypothetical protein ABIH18_02035 [Candidatus Omnitrophota bacterium]
MKTLVGITIGIVLIFSGFVYASDNYKSKRYAALIFAQDYQQELITEGRKIEKSIRKKEKSSSKREKKVERLEKEEAGIGHLEIGPEIYYFRYKEPGVMKEDGMMYGLTGAYSWHNNFMLKAEGRIAGGQVDYEGSGTIDNISDFSAEVRGLGGYDFKPSEEFIITPYFGIGYRYLNDDASGKISSTNYGGYERESNYIYSPIGVEGVFNMQDGWSIGGLVEYDIFWQGKQKSHLSDVRCYDPIAGYYTDNDVENDQDKGYGIRGSIKLLKKGEKLDFVIEPFIRYWNIKKSKEVATSTISENGLWIKYGTVIEPKNNSTEIGVKFMIGF